jgi:3-phosphoshikimate 1-carboxyvinyltransferase
MNLDIQPLSQINGTITVDPDKSISHRAILLSSLAEGESVIRNCLLADDVKHTLQAVRDCGIEAKVDLEGTVRIAGRGLFGFEAPDEPLYLGNSGTSMRLLMGVLAGQHFQCELHGDESLSRRPMERVTKPLVKMGAKAMGITKPGYPPLFIQGARLKAIQYELPVASAQVKSAILLAALYAQGETTVVESIRTRDHSENMLRLYGVDIEKKGNEISLRGPAVLKAQSLEIPGDPSSAAFFLVAATLISHSKIVIHEMNLNPIRIEYIHILRRMGAKIDIEEKSTRCGEPCGTVTASSASLKGVDISTSEIPGVIDELPILMTAASFAKGSTRIQGASELREKETDRIHSMVEGLGRMGVQITQVQDSIHIKGGGPLRGSEVLSYQDHRTAMSLAIAALAAQGTSRILHADCITTSFPSFCKILTSLKKGA